MLEISYLELVAVTTIIWVVVRLIVAKKSNNFSVKREALLILVYICIIVIARMVNFPFHHENGHIAPMVFDASQIYPFWLNLVPLVHLADVYDGWQINIIGNITMFIPVGIVWPVCFKKLNSVGKVTLAGFGFSLAIEIFQLLFYDRCSDVDDLFLNTLGTFIGAVIYFAIKKIYDKKHTSHK